MKKGDLSESRLDILPTWYSHSRVCAGGRRGRWLRRNEEHSDSLDLLASLFVEFSTASYSFPFFSLAARYALLRMSISEHNHYEDEDDIDYTEIEEK